MFERFDRIVRCSRGHLFATLWVPLMSFKAVRLGTRRLQFCPVGRHWSAVKIIDPATLTPAELDRARSVHDVRVP